MFKKFLCFSIILLFGLILLNQSYATDVLMDLNNTNNTNNNEAQTIDNEMYETASNSIEDASDYDTPITTTVTDYEDSTDLSISNMLNIMLIVVGIVLVLLGIAIIIKLR